MTYQRIVNALAAVYFVAQGLVIVAFFALLVRFFVFGVN